MFLLMAFPIGSDLASIELKALPAPAQPVWLSGAARTSLSVIAITAARADPPKLRHDGDAVPPIQRRSAPRSREYANVASPQADLCVHRHGSSVDNRHALVAAANRDRGLCHPGSRRRHRRHCLVQRDAHLYGLLPAVI